MNKKRQYILIAVLAAVLVVNLVLAFCLDAMTPDVPTEPPATEPTTAPTQAPTEAPTQAPTQAPTEPQSETFLLTFTGDSTLGTEEGDWEGSDNFVNTVGVVYDYPYRNVADIFAADECTFTNLEGVFAEKGVGTAQDKRFRFRGPLAYTQILTGSSVEVVSLANNHTYDYGQPGLTSTKNALDASGIKYAEHQGSVLFTTKNGLKIGMYAISFTMDEADLREEVAQLRANGAEIVILALHRGDEGIYSPNENQIHIAHTAIDAGCDIVWGHHPHVLQEIEEYNGGIIMYSLGNFSFGGNRNPRDKDSAIVQQEVIRESDGTVHLGKLNIIPCCISSTSNYNNYQPTPYAEGTVEYERVLSKLRGTFTGPDIPPNYADPTEPPTQAPTQKPTKAPTEPPTEAPTQKPTKAPTEPPTEAPTQEPTQVPTDAPTEPPTQAPTQAPTDAPTEPPTEPPTQAPTDAPTEPPVEPTEPPTEDSTEEPTEDIVWTE
ncbi:MAG: CapA family protein [Oscillospiraceae bacterium]|nr:CapA family protein [Oscillospiraceae bacterium]